MALGVGSECLALQLTQCFRCGWRCAFPDACSDYLLPSLPSCCGLWRPGAARENKLFHNCFSHSVSSQKKEKVTNTCSVPDVILRTQLPRMGSDRPGNLSNLMLPVTKSSVLPSKKCGMVTSQKHCFVIIKYDGKYDFKSPRAHLPWRRHSVIMVMSLWVLSPSVCVCLSHTEYSHWMEVPFISSDARMARL